MAPVVQYEPREMLRLMEQRPRPTTFLRDMLVGEENLTNKTILEIDQVFGGQMVAGYVNRKGGPNIVGKGGFNTLLHLAPYYYEEIPYTPSDLDVRPAGETVYADPAAYLNSRVERWLADLEDRMIRAEERQVAEALQTGKVAVSGKDVDYEIDFGMDAGHIITLAGANRWSEATATPLDDLRDWVQLCIDKGAPPPSVLIGDPKSIGYLRSDSNVVALLDNRRIDIGAINPALVRAQRATYWGNLRGDGFDLDLYTYQGMYTTESGGSLTTHRYMGSNQVILTSPETDIRMHYAKIENFKTGDFIGRRFPHMWEDDRGKNRFITMESGPMVGLHQPDGVVTVTVSDA